ncbi:hypothetical protein [Desulfonatronovibrio magnus]|uniref:hypothetical protein n=1 Tax=Desulfonatronovibrio magnus TaxID=698827 RepID=UPI0005EB463F|nr:hypothetical protein [Desulfonatronovibrio magnus]
MIFVVKKCADCPFCNTLESNEMQCNVSTPGKRDIPDQGRAKPSFCPLRREQAIVRSFGEADG